MKVPCKDCDKRYVGCHSECESYTEYRRWKDSQRTAEVIAEKSIVEYEQSRFFKTMKRVRRF